MELLVSNYLLAPKPLRRIDPIRITKRYRSAFYQSNYNVHEEI